MKQKSQLEQCKLKLRRRAVKNFHRKIQNCDTLAQEWGHKGYLAKTLDSIRLAATLHELNEPNPFAETIIQ